MADAVSTMFVSDFIEVPASPAEVTARIAARHWTHDAGVGDIDLGTPRARDDSTYVPVLWTLRDQPASVTVLVGDLEIAPGGGGGTVVGLHASYAAPRGALRGDRVLQRRVARHVRAELQRLGASIGSRPADCVEVEP